MKVKVGDKVKILAGKDRGKEGTITKTISKKSQVVVDGINIVKKHMKPNQFNEAGGIVEMPAPIHVSNVKVITKDTKKEVKKTEKTTEKAPAKKAEAKKTTKRKAGDK